MKNKKGFSLVELLIVIAIIGVFSGIVIPSVVRYLKSGKDEYNAKLETELVTVAKSYYAENKSELPRGNLDSNGLRITKTLISASYLVNNNYMTGEFKDSEGNDYTNTSYVIVEKEGNDYIYTSCISGNGYKNNNEKCNYVAPSADGTMRDYILPSCKLTRKSGTINSWTNQNVYLTLTAEDNSGLAYYYLNQDTDGTQFVGNPSNSEVDIEIKDNIGKGSYYATVEDTSARKIQCVFDGEIKIDKTKPNIDSFTIKSNNSSINTKNITVTVKGSDEDSGSGVDKVCVTTSNDSSTCTWYDIESGTYTNNDYNVSSSDGSGKTDTLYAFVKDKAGNISESQSVSYKLYTYCTKKEVYKESDWSSCSESCGGGTQTKTLYYRDYYFNSYTTCGSSSESRSCNTGSCSAYCYRVNAGSGLNCRSGRGTGYRVVTSLYAYSYYMFKYDSSGWYYNTDYGCYASSDYLDYYGTSCPSSGGGSSSGGSSGGGSNSSSTCYGAWSAWSEFQFGYTSKQSDTNIVDWSCVQIGSNTAEYKCRYRTRSTYSC